MATEIVCATRVSTDGPGLLSPVASPHAARTAVYDRVVEASFERGGGGPAAAVVEHATPSSSTDFSPGKILATHLASQYPATVLLRAAGLRAEGAAVTPTALFAGEASPERADSPASSVDSQGTVGSETEDDEVAGLLAPPPRAERSLSDRDAAEPREPARLPQEPRGGLRRAGRAARPRAAAAAAGGAPPGAAKLPGGAATGPRPRRPTATGRPSRRSATTPPSPSRQRRMAAQRRAAAAAAAAGKKRAAPAKIYPFSLKLCEMVTDAANHDVIRWNYDTRELEVMDENRLSADILPHYFKSNNIITFQRQLNYYGFSKIFRGTQTLPIYRNDDRDVATVEDLKFLPRRAVKRASTSPRARAAQPQDASDRGLPYWPGDADDAADEPAVETPRGAAPAPPSPLSSPSSSAASLDILLEAAMSG
ncbi:DNA binding protein [Aureococcus anophagefferens]|nr:DNA binding protein [Aureococcus anophagefferens]